MQSVCSYPLKQVGDAGYTCSEIGLDGPIYAKPALSILPDVYFFSLAHALSFSLQSKTTISLSRHQSTGFRWSVTVVGHTPRLDILILLVGRFAINAIHGGKIVTPCIVFTFTPSLLGTRNKCSTGDTQMAQTIFKYRMLYDANNPHVKNYTN